MTSETFLQAMIIFMFIVNIWAAWQNLRFARLNAENAKLNVENAAEIVAWMDRMKAEREQRAAS